MASLLDRIKGVEFGDNNDLDNTPEIPDEVPEEWGAELTADPVPGPRGRTSSALTPTTFGKVTPTMQKKIAEQIAMYIELLAAPVELRDPVCGGAIGDQAEALGKAFAKILARYPEAAHKMLAGGVLGDWIAVMLAAKPIGEAIWNHHIVKTGDDGGQDDYADFAIDPSRPGI